MPSFIKPDWQVISVGLLIHKGKILLGLRHADQKEQGEVWEFPGGSVEAREHPQATMIREFKEELGIEVKESEIAACLCDYRKKASRLIVFFYVNSWKGKIKKICHKRLGWFSIEDCLKKRIPNINPDLFEQIINVIGKKLNN